MIIPLILVPVIAGPVMHFIGHRFPKAFNNSVTAALLLELILAIVQLGRVGDSLILPGVCGMGLSFTVYGLQAWLCALASFMWLVSGIFSVRYEKHDRDKFRYYLFLLVTEGAIMGVFLSADLFTTLAMFETMSFASYEFVIHRGTKGALRAGASYMAYAVIGGMISLMGLFILWVKLGTLSYDALRAALASYTGDMGVIFAASCLALVTFAAKVCVFPLHTWLPNSYREAPAPAAALLSGIITKAGMFGIFGITLKLGESLDAWGNMILIFGIITALVGGFMALCNTDLKKTVAYSSMSQIGFILVGTGMVSLMGHENGMAVWGSILHLTNHSLIKLVLLLAAGVVMTCVSTLEYDTIRGFGRNKPALWVAFCLPALGVMGVPGFNGYISKTLIHEAMVEYIEHLEHMGVSAGMYHVAEWLFLIAGGMTVGYMVKLFICIFVEKNTDPALQAKYDGMRKSYASKVWVVLLDGCSVIFPVFGLLPHLTQDKIAAFSQDFFGNGLEESVRYFSLGNIKGACISLAFGALFYLLFVRVFVRHRNGYRNPWPQALDIEEKIYYPLLFKFLPFVGAMCARTLGSLFEWLTLGVNKLLFLRYDKYVHPEEDNYFGRYAAEDPGVRGFRGQLAYGLAFFGIGFAAVVVYLVISNFIL